MSSFRDASWNRRPEDPTDFEVYSPANILRERARTNLQFYTWAVLVVSGIACGFFITGWKWVAFAVAAAIVAAIVLAWFQHRHR